MSIVQRSLKNGPAVLLGVLTVFFLPAVPFAAPATERVFTLDEAVDTGLHNSQEYLALQEQAALAQQRINEAKALIYPKIDFNLSASRFNHDLPTVLAPSFNSIFLPQGAENLYYTTRFSLWQYLYAGGRYTTTVRLAEINLSQAQSQAAAARNRIILDVKRSFYACLSAQERIRAFEQALAGITAPGDKNFTPQERSAFENRLRNAIREAQHEYEKNQLTFLHTIGIELGATVEITRPEIPAFEDFDLNKCLAQAYRYRPELRQTQFEETIDSLRVNLSLTERYPTVTLGANYEWVGDNFPLSDKNWNATLNFNVPIFDGWASWARIKQRKNQAREGKIRRARIEDQIRYEVRQAHLDYAFWKKRFQSLAGQPQPQDPEPKLEAALAAIDVRQNAVVSKAALEWAIGSAFK